MINEISPTIFSLFSNSAIRSVSVVLKISSYFLVNSRIKVTRQSVISF